MICKHYWLPAKLWRKKKNHEIAAAAEPQPESLAKQEQTQPAVSESKSKQALQPESSVETEAAAESETVTTPKIIPQITEQVTATTKRAAEVDRWAAMIDELDLQGLTRQLARNSVFTQNSDKNVLVVRKNWAYLLNDGAVASIKEAMVEQFDIELHDILVGDAEAATPVEIQQQINAFRLDAAKQTLADDPLAQQLTHEFGATLTADSVKPD